MVYGLPEKRLVPLLWDEFGASMLAGVGISLSQVLHCAGLISVPAKHTDGEAVSLFSTVLPSPLLICLHSYRCKVMRNCRCANTWQVLGVFSGSVAEPRCERQTGDQIEVSATRFDKYGSVPQAYIREKHTESGGQLKQKKRLKSAGFISDL